MGVPTVRLQNCNIIIFFVLSDFFRNLHPLADNLHQFVVQLIDLLS